MATFSYTAMDSNTGKEVKGTVEADTVALAASLIREKGLLPTNVVEGKAKSGMSLSFNFKIPFLGGKVKTKQLVLFTRQLATLIDAGLPLLRSLNVLMKQEQKGNLRNTIQSLADTVERGTTFSDAMAQHPKVFDRLYVSMVKAGEIGGVLEVVLNRLAEFAEKAQAMKRKVIAAMAYPGVVMFFACSVVLGLLTFIVPKFSEIFQDFDTELPGPTILLISLSENIKSNFVYGVAVVVGTVFLYKSMKKVPKTAYYVDKVKLKLPALGALIQRVAVARFSRTLGTLIGSGVPILQALNITKDTAGNEVLRLAIADVHASIREGETIADPLEKSGVFPPMLVNMINVGEETGQLDTMLLKIADNYDDEVDAAVAGLSSMLEPIMIVFMGSMVGFIVVAMFMPLFKLALNIGG